MPVKMGEGGQEELVGGYGEKVVAVVDFVAVVVDVGVGFELCVVALGFDVGVGGVASVVGVESAASVAGVGDVGDVAGIHSISKENKM
jgi:hypothetical protein